VTEGAIALGVVAVYAVAALGVLAVCGLLYGAWRLFRWASR